MRVLRVVSFAVMAVAVATSFIVVRRRRRRALPVRVYEIR